MYLSLIIPAYNEAENVAELHKKILAVVKGFNREFEIIFINDGSTDNTLAELQKLSPIKIINFRKNFGQTAALDAGIKVATGELIITLDADLQNDPADIPALIRKLKEGYDVVSGWRYERQDPYAKKFLSRGANWLRKYIVNDNIQDSGCTLKVFKRECFENLDLFGEMHRFIPALLRWRGFKIGEIKVQHHPRIHGETKYHWQRVVKGFLDMLGIWFWQKYSSRPIHLFGTVGLIASLSGVLLLVFLFILRFLHLIALTTSVWFIIAIFLILMGIQLFISGLLADIAIKNYYKQDRRPYYIKDILEQ